MLNVKPRLSSIFRQICANPATLVAALFIAIAAGTDANAHPDLIVGDAAIQESTASISGLDTGGHVWLELAGYTPVAAVHPQPSSDLLGRLRGGFDLPLHLNPRVQSELNWYDGRRDVVDSTRGALEYLAYLHELMDGDWMLAIASYNSGEGNVMKAVKRNRAASRPTDFWSLSLSRETSAYVPRLMALVAIVSSPESFGLTLPDLVNEPQSADARREKQQNTERSGNRIEHIVAAGESFWTIGRRYDVGTRELAAWNGMAPRDTLSIGQKLVVWTSQATPAKPIASNGKTRKLNYIVRRGDSLYLIANRFRITIGDLVRWNKIDATKILRPGQKLTMYVDVMAQSG